MVKFLTITKGVLLLVSIGITGLKAQSTLYVKEKSGTQTAFALSGIRKLNFPDSSVTITKTNAGAQNYSLGSVRFLSFKNYFTGIPNPGSNQNDALKLYPNPANDILQIEYTGDQSNSLTMEILDLQGRVLLKSYLQNRKTSIDVTNIKAGIYLCRLQDSEVIVRKFMKN